MRILCAAACFTICYLGLSAQVNDCCLEPLNVAAEVYHVYRGFPDETIGPSLGVSIRSAIVEYTNGKGEITSNRIEAWRSQENNRCLILDKGPNSTTLLQEPQALEWLTSFPTGTLRHEDYLDEDDRVCILQDFPNSNRFGISLFWTSKASTEPDRLPDHFVSDCQNEYMYACWRAVNTRGVERELDLQATKAIAAESVGYLEEFGASDYIGDVQIRKLNKELFLIVHPGPNGVIDFRELPFDVNNPIGGRERRAFSNRSLEVDDKFMLFAAGESACVASSYGENIRKTIQQRTKSPEESAAGS